jgi:sulfur carrier protein
MQIFLNGESLKVVNSLSIDELLTQLELSKKRIAVELNQEIIPRSLHATTQLQEGDAVEVIHAIGGG